MITIKNVGDLSTILRHYKAIPILIRYIKEQPDHRKVLKEWDDARDFRNPLEYTIEIHEEER